jgi:hypothetical protein
MPAMPSLTPVDESFFESAPQVLAHTWEIAQPAQAVWAELTGPQPLHWVRGLNVRWKSPAPYGVGSTRTASVLGLVTVQEHFFIWEEGHRKAFYASAANLPVFNALAEDYVVESRGPNACAFTWKIAIAPSPLGKPGAPLNRVVFGAGFRDTGKYFHAA